MVSNLQFFERDPMYPRMDRGRGWYYKRGRLTTGLVGGAGTRNPPNQRGEYWSFYSRSSTKGSVKDARRAAYPTKVKKKTDAERKAPHKADYKTRKGRADGGVKATKNPHRRQTRYVKNRRTTRAGEGIEGFF